MRRARHPRLAALLVGIAFAATPAAARLNRTELARVAVVPPPGARVPLDLAWNDAAGDRPTTLGKALGGRPTLLLPVDYTCGNVCDPMLSMSGAALAATGLVAGRDVSLVLVGIDPRDDAAAARHMLDTELGNPGLSAQAAALVGDAAAVDRLTQALGYRFVYDAGTDSFAHPAAAILLTGDGRVARVLSPLALNGSDLRLALVEAGEGRTGSLADRLVLLCYGYDAATGVYTPMIRRVLSFAAAGTILAMAIGIVLLSRRPRQV
ncbi:SCO family protein [Methylobacterium sp. E-025]|uniref:SCO family protein n=1 Tax=Methylobacterium sp. E-025 TaxID=2836561 RepID=UPI001FBB1954|nr:SCO family protein [Methylobacterium sp. E-025]MCJ2110060.1 SCO family protein [Methylobacterium sp. E-025]